MSESAQAVASALRGLLGWVPRRWQLSPERAFHLQVGPTWAVPVRQVPELHLLYVVRGGGWYALDDRYEPFVPGRVYVIAGGLRHSGGMTPSDPPEIIPLRILARDNVTGKRVPLGMPACGVAFVPPHSTRFAGLFDAVYRAHVADTPLQRSLASSLLHQLIVELVLALDQPPPRDARIERVVRQLETSPARTWTLAELAATAHLSPKYLLRLFRHQVGMTPAVYHAHVRCRRATYLLTEADLPVKAVADALGFPDPFTFSRQYKRITGRSPSQAG